MTNSRPTINVYAAVKKRAVFVVVFTMLFASCTNSMKDINDLVGQNKVQPDRGTDVTILYSDGAKIKARLFTHLMIRNEGANPPYTDMKNGLKVEFFDDSAVVKNTITARNGRYYEQQKNILLRDSVVVVNDKGEKLETQELVWNQSAREFFTEKPISITTSDKILFGRGMKATQDFSSYEITVPTGVVRVNKNEVPGQ